MRTFYILGKDKRYEELKTLLETSFPVFLRSPRKSEKGTVIFPMLIKDDETRAVLFSLTDKNEAVGGRFSEDEKKYLEDNSVPYTELLKNPHYLEKNAEETAEGTLCEIIGNTKELLSSSTALVIGFGNCGKKIARLLWTCGGEVYIHSHEGSMKKAEAEGFNLFDIESPRIKMFDFIVNTAPGEIFTEEVISKLLRGTLIFQVASGECGNKETFGKYGIKVINLPGLPARYSPLTEAEAIFRTLFANKR